MHTKKYTLWRRAKAPASSLIAWYTPHRSHQAMSDTHSASTTPINPSTNQSSLQPPTRPRPKSPEETFVSNQRRWSGAREHGRCRLLNLQAISNQALVATILTKRATHSRPHPSSNVMRRYDWCTYICVCECVCLVHTAQNQPLAILLACGGLTEQQNVCG